MVEAKTKTNKNQILLLVPCGMEADEQGWAAKFSTGTHPVKVVTSKKPCNNFVGIAIYALASDAEGSAECTEFFANTYKNVPANVKMTDAGNFNTNDLVAKIGEASDSIKKVFDSFDKDKSGFIDRNELKAMIAQVGIEMNDMDVYNMMQDLDRNKDGKISIDEFNAWWLTGRKGVTGTMSRLMEAASRKAGSKFDDIPNLVTLCGDVPAIQTRTSYAEFGLNKANMMGKADNTMSSFYAKAQLGPDARAIGKSIMARVNPGQEKEDPTNGYAHISLKMKEDFNDAQFGEGGFCAFFEKASKIAPVPVPVTCTYQDGCYHFTSCAPLPPAVPGFAEELINKVAVTQSAEFQFQMGATPKEILAGLGNGKNPLQFAMQGIAVRKSVEMWDGFIATMVKMMNSGEETNPVLMQILMGMIPSYLAQFKGSLNIDVDEEAIEEIWQTIKEMAPPSLAKVINGDNASCRAALTNLKSCPKGTKEEDEFDSSKFGGKSDVDAINMEEGNWGYIEGHKNVKSVAEGIKLFSNFVEAQFEAITEQESEPKIPDGSKGEKMMVGSLMHVVSMIFGDEVHFEGFACPQSPEGGATDGALSWEKSGVPVSVKGSIRMEGASEIMQLMSFNVNQF